MKYFDVVKTENIKKILIEGAEPYLMAASLNAKGEDYYDFQKTLSAKFTCVIDAESSILRYFNEDASTIAPGIGERVFGIDEIPDDVTFDGTWKFDERTNTFHQDAALATAYLVSINTSQRNVLMQNAFREISIIQNSALLQNERDSDAADLVALQQYVDALRDVDLTAPAWPEIPTCGNASN